MAKHQDRPSFVSRTVGVPWRRWRGTVTDDAAGADPWKRPAPPPAPEDLGPPPYVEGPEDAEPFPAPHGGEAETAVLAHDDAPVHDEPPAAPAAYPPPLPASSPLPAPPPSPAQPPTQPTPAPSVRRSRTDLPRLTSRSAPAVAGDAGRAGRHLVVVGSRVGNQHRAYGFGREDAYAATSTPNETCTVVAVADGVGSTRHAGVAAQLASAQAVQLVAARVENRGITASPAHDDMWQQMARPVADELAARLDAAIVDEAAHNWPYRALRPEFASKDLRAPATTLCLAAIWPGSPAAVVRYLQVGDSELWTLRVDAGEWRRASGGAPRGSSRSKHTSSLPRDPDKTVIGAFALPPDPPTVLVLATDGGARLVEALPVPVADAVTRAVGTADPDPVLSVLASDVETLHDDRTLLVVDPYSDR